MSKLSPAAQAVLDAFLDTAVDAGNYYATRNCQIAAALRAAADHLNHSTSAHTLYVIADELEQGAPIDTTETTP
jgi:hypothetical protein